MTDREPVLYVKLVDDIVIFYIVNDIQTASFRLSLAEAQTLAHNISEVLMEQ